MKQIGLEKGKIASNAAILLIAGFVMGSSVILSTGPSARNEAWLAVSAGLALGLGCSWIFATLLKRFPGKSFVEIAETALGKWLGKAIGFMYLLYMFHLGSLVMTNTLFFLKNTVYPNTPAWVLLFVMTLMAVYAAWNGAEVISRCGFVFVAVTMALFLTTTLFIMKEFKWNNFFPLATPFRNLAWGSFQAFTFPFGETVVFLMFLPYLKKINQASGVYFTGITLGGFFLLLSAVRTTGVLGPTAAAHTFPSFSVAKLIDIAGFFTRLEMISGFNFIMTTFLKISVLLYGTSLGSAQLLELKDYRFLAVPWGFLMLVFGLYNFGNFMENVEFAKYTYPIYAVFIQGFIPVLILVIAWIRKVPPTSARGGEL